MTRGADGSAQSKGRAVGKQGAIRARRSGFSHGKERRASMADHFATGASRGLSFSHRTVAVASSLSFEQASDEVRQRRASRVKIRCTRWVDSHVGGH